MIRFWEFKLTGASPLLSCVVRRPEGFRVVWSERREQERQEAVGRWLDIACEHAELEPPDLARYSSLRVAGSLSEAIVALIEVGDLRSRSPDFWEAVRQAAEQLWLVHPWAVSAAEHARRMQYLVGLQSRITGWEP